MTPTELHTLVENELILLKERNKKVEENKAWEGSVTRRFFVALITYIVFVLILWMQGVSTFYLNALVPPIGYLISTLSLPFIKEWWLKNIKRT